MAVSAALAELCTLDMLLLASLDALLASPLAELSAESLALEIEAAAPVSLALAADIDKDARLDETLAVALLREAEIDVRLALSSDEALDSRLETIEVASPGERLVVFVGPPPISVEI